MTDALPELPPVLEPGGVVDSRYVLVQLLGVGGAGSVWLADDVEEARPVALKVVHAELMGDDRIIVRFAREAGLLLSLEHPNIARCYGCRLDHDPPYLAMELVTGGPLKDDLAERAPHRHYTTEELLEVFEQIVDAVEYAHSRGILHRDLNASNVMLDTTEGKLSVRVVDFGLAKLLDTDRSHATTYGRILGTPTSISPEQAFGAEVDARSDVFALGVLLFEMITLHRPWVLNDDGSLVAAYSESIPQNGRNTPTSLLSRIVSEERPDPRLVRPALSKKVATLVTRAMALDPLERPATPRELLSDLAAALEGVSLAPLSPTHVLPGRGRRPLGEAQIHTDVVQGRLPSTAGYAATAPLVVIQPSRASVITSRIVLAAVVLSVVFVGVLVLAKLGDRKPIVLPKAPPVIGTVLPSEPTASAGAPVATERETSSPSPIGPRERRTRGGRPRLMQPPVVEAAAPNPSIGRMRALVERLKRDPSDGRTLRKLTDAIRTESAKLDDEKVRARIERLVVSSSLVVDVNGLERAVSELEGTE